MTINIVTENDKWVFNRMANEILKVVDGKISQSPDPKADINYFINYGYYVPVNTLTAAWFTHPDPNLLDRWEKAESEVDLAFYQASRYKPDHPLAYKLTPSGIENSILPRLKIVVMGRIYSDGRKGEDRLQEVISDIPFTSWHFVGSGWEKLRPYLNKTSIMYVEEWKSDKQVKNILSDADFFLSMSRMEAGSIAHLEAAKMGVKILSFDVGNSELWGMNTIPCKDVGEIVRAIRSELHKKYNQNIACGNTWGRWAYEHQMYFEKLMAGELIGLQEAKGKLTVIVPIYGQSFFVERLFHSLPHLKPQVVLVDDKSPNEETREALEVIDLYDGFDVVYNEKNLGFARTCNVGANHANTKYLCFVNSDIEIPPSQQHLFDDCISRMETDEEIGVMGVRLLFSQHTLQHGGVKFDWEHLRPEHRWKGEDGFNPKYCQIEGVDFVTGAFLFVRKDVFDEVGGFPEIYGRGYYEDTELITNIRKLGYKIVYNGLVWAYHYHNRTFAHLDGSRNIRLQRELFRQRNLSTLQELLVNR